MEYIIVAFRSRTHTVKFYEYLQKANLGGEIVNTPKEAGVGCGLSVKVSLNRFNLVKRAVTFAKLSSFAGFFAVKTVAGKKIVRTIF